MSENKQNQIHFKIEASDQQSQHNQVSISSKIPMLENEHADISKFSNELDLLQQKQKKNQQNDSLSSQTSKENYQFSSSSSQLRSQNIQEQNGNRQEMKYQQGILSLPGLSQQSNQTVFSHSLPQYEEQNQNGFLEDQFSRNKTISSGKDIDNLKKSYSFKEIYDYILHIRSNPNIQLTEESHPPEAIENRQIYELNYGNPTQIKTKKKVLLRSKSTPSYSVLTLYPLTDSTGVYSDDIQMSSSNKNQDPANEQQQQKFCSEIQSTTQLHQENDDQANFNTKVAANKVPVITQEAGPDNYQFSNLCIPLEQLIKNEHIQCTYYNDSIDSIREEINQNNTSQSPICSQELISSFSKKNSKNGFELETIKEEENIAQELSDKLVPIEDTNNSETDFQMKEVIPQNKEQSIQIIEQFNPTEKLSNQLKHELIVNLDNNQFHQLNIQSNGNPLNQPHQPLLKNQIKIQEHEQEKEQKLNIQPSNFSQKISIPLCLSPDSLIQQSEDKTNDGFIQQQVKILKEVLTLRKTGNSEEDGEEERRSNLFEKMKKNQQERQKTDKSSSNEEYKENFIQQINNNQKETKVDGAGDRLRDVLQLQQLISIKTDQIKHQIQALQNNRNDKENNDEDNLSSKSDSEQGGMSFTLQEIESIIDRKMTELINQLQKKQPKSSKIQAKQQKDSSKKSKIIQDQDDISSNLEECKLINLYSKKSEEQKSEEQSQILKKKLSALLTEQQNQTNRQPCQKKQEEEVKQDINNINSSIKSLSHSKSTNELIYNDSQLKDNDKQMNLLEGANKYDSTPKKCQAKLNQNNFDSNEQSTTSYKKQNKINLNDNDEKQKQIEIASDKQSTAAFYSTGSSSKKQPIGISEYTSLPKHASNSKNSERQSPSNNNSNNINNKRENTFKNNNKLNNFLNHSQSAHLIILTKNGSNISSPICNSIPSSCLSKNLVTQKAVRRNTPNGIQTQKGRISFFAEGASKDDSKFIKQGQSSKNANKPKEVEAFIIENKKALTNQIQRKGSLPSFTKQSLIMAAPEYYLNQSRKNIFKLSSINLTSPFNFTNKNSPRGNSLEQRRSTASRERQSLERRNAEKEYLEQQRKEEEKYKNQLQKEIEEQEMKLQKIINLQNNRVPEQNKNKRNSSSHHQRHTSLENQIKSRNSYSESQSSNNFVSQKKVKSSTHQIKQELLNSCSTRGEYLYQAAIIQNQRKKEIAEKVKNAEKKKLEKECTFTPSLLSSRASRNISPNNFSERQEEWKKRVEVKKNRIKEASYAESDRQYTFRPELYQKINFNDQNLFVQQFHSSIEKIKQKKIRSKSPTMSNGPTQNNISRERTTSRYLSSRESQKKILSTENIYLSQSNSMNWKNSNYKSSQQSKLYPHSFHFNSSQYEERSEKSQTTVEKEIADYRKAVEKLNGQKAVLISQCQI